MTGILAMGNPKEPEDEKEHHRTTDQPHGQSLPSWIHSSFLLDLSKRTGPPP
jgi:hypothetical protein